MFRRLDASVLQSFDFEGCAIAFRAGDSVAAALAAAGVLELRPAACGQPASGAFCMMGVCFACRVEIDGRREVRACQTAAAAAMQVRRSRAELSPGRNDVR